MKESRRLIEIEDIWSDLKRHSRLYYIILPIVFVFSLIYSIGQPNLYKSQVVLSSELVEFNPVTYYFIDKGRDYFDLIKNKETISPPVYSLIVNSFEFRNELLNTIIRIEDGNREVTYQDYLLNYQKNPWWANLLHEKEYIKPDPIDPMRLTKLQYDLLEAVGNRIKCNYNTRAVVLTLSVTDQDPLICAYLADKARKVLERRIIKYSAQKAEQDLLYQKKIADQRKSDYDKARNNYVKYADANRNVVSQKVMTEISFLENEMNIQYNMYEEACQDAIKSDFKTQESKPVLAIIQSPTAPYERVSPDRVSIVMLNLINVFYLITIYVLYKETYWRRNILK